MMTQVLGPLTHRGGLHKCGSWLCTSNALAVVAKWGVRQQVEDLSHFLSFLLYLCLSNKTNNITEYLWITQFDGNTEPGTMRNPSRNKSVCHEIEQLLFTKCSSTASLIFPNQETSKGTHPDHKTGQV